METVWLVGSTTHTAGLWLLFVSAVAGISMVGPEFTVTTPVTVAPSRISSGGSLKPTLTSNVRVTGSAWGATVRIRPRAFTFGSLVKLTRNSGSLGPDRMNWAGTWKT